MIGRQLSHFRVIEKIGEGGMGVVYRAEDQRLGRQVALKVMRQEFVAHEERRRRFIREARSAASLTHPNIVTVHEVDEVEGVTFIAMELLDGEDLGARLQRGPLSAADAVRVASEVAEGLARAHGAGIVHRDLKPDNVVIGAGDRVTILDFGLAKLCGAATTAGPGEDTDIPTISLSGTQDGRILGTVAYMSPEQARGLPADSRSDVFAFGVLLYEMITGRPPFLGATITDTLTAILRDHPAPIATFSPSAPAELERIMNLCLEKDPAERYQVTARLADELRALRRLTESDTQPLPRVSLPGTRRRPTALRWPRSRILAPSAILGAALTLSVALPHVWRGFSPALSAPPAATASLAVLPFNNMQDSDDPGRFGQILQELIITDLSGLDTVNIYSSQRLFDIQKRLGRIDMRTIDRDMASQVAREAGAGTMLTGSFSRLGERWILTSQLVDVARGTVVVSERIDGPDLYTMVDDLTARIRGNIGLAAAAGPTDMAVRDRTSSSIEAYQAYLRGNDLLDDLRFAEAVEAFRHAVTIDPDFGQAYYKLAIASWWNRGMESPDAYAGAEAPGEILEALLAGDLKLGAKDRMLAEAVLALVKMQYVEARELYEALVERFPDEKEAWYGLGEVLRHGPGGGADEPTLRAFVAAIDLDPGFRLAYYHAAEIYEKSGPIDEGIDRLGRLVALYPDDGVWRGKYAALVVRRGDPAEIERVIREALDGTGDPAGQREFLATLADAHLRRGALDDATALIDRGLAIASEEPPTRLALLRARVQLYRQQFADAERIYRQSLAAEPGNRDAVLGLATIFEEQRRNDEALVLLRSAARAHPHPAYFGRWVEFAAVRGDRPEVEQAIRAASELPADRAKPGGRQKQLLAVAERAYRELGDFVSAEAFARRALGVEPAAADHARLGWTLIGQGRFDEAGEAFRAGLALEPDDALNLRGLVRLGLQDARFDEALAGGRRCAKALPGHGELALLEAYAVTGDLQAADALVEEGRRRTTDVGDTLEMLTKVAEVFIATGQQDRALARLDEAQAALPGIPIARVSALRAWALLKSGRPGEAGAVVRDALATAPRHWLLNVLDAGLRLDRDPAAAERIARDLLSTGPAHAEVLTVLATALTRQGQHEEALQYARQRAAMQPGRAGQTLVAWVLIDGELDVDEGIQLAEAARLRPRELTEASRTLPYHASPEHCLGLAYLKKGNPGKAASLLEEAANLRPDRPSIAEHLRQAVARRA